MKTIHTLIIILFSPFILLAQKEYRKFSIGGGVGIVQSVGDVNSSQFKQVYLGSAEYYLTPYISGMGELQVGNMSGSDPSNNRYFNNNFKAVMGVARIYMGQFMDKYRGAFVGKTNSTRALEGVFLSAGAGAIKSVQREIYRQKDNPMFQGNNADRDIFFPVSIGIDNSGFNSRLITGIRYQYNFALGDQVDGYAISGSRSDMFSSVTMSIKYKFGPIGLY